MTHQIIEMDKKGLREFGFITGAIVAALFGLLVPWLFDNSYPLWPWYIFAALVSVALIMPIALNPVYKIWMRFGLVMGWINTRIILGAVFYTMFTPIAIVFKLIGKDLLNCKLDKNIKSYRIESKINSREHMENPF